DVLNLSYSEQAIKAKSIVIYNAIGTKVKTLNTTGENKQINVNELASGMYYLRILGENELVIKNIPFIKQ
ncbi:T9SS type A sorting domain-containing protein, partial [uncultured Algibacter sp.]|uniref:T9SS type A sorting domain-containing protein n=1 Tax=uncultured Algibacter sp. TaxID=298659 RepID=UPI0032164EA7